MASKTKLRFIQKVKSRFCALSGVGDLAGILNEPLYRIQYSVFLGSMKKTVFRNLSKTLTGFFPDTEQADDRLFILPITATNLKRITELGTFSAIDWDEIAGNKTTIYIGD